MYIPLYSRLNKIIYTSYKQIVYYLLFFSINFNTGSATPLNIYEPGESTLTQEITRENTNILDKFNLFGVIKKDGETTPPPIERIDLELGFIHYSKRQGYLFSTYTKEDKECYANYKYLDFFPEIGSNILDIKTSLNNTGTKIIEGEACEFSRHYGRHIAHQYFITTGINISFIYSNEKDTLLFFLKKPIFLFNNQKLVKILSPEIYMYRLKSLDKFNGLHY